MKTSASSSSRGKSFATQSIVSNGQLHDIPLAGRFDGDNCADLAAFRATTGQWLIRPSTNYTPLITRVFGARGDVPLAGDFDGDGLFDLALWRPRT